MHDTVQSAEGEGGREGRAGSINVSSLSKSCWKSETLWEKKNHWVLSFFLLVSFFFFYTHPYLWLGFWQPPRYFRFYFKKSASLLCFLILSVQVVPRFCSVCGHPSVCLSVCLTHSRPGSSASSCSWNLSVFFPYYSVLKTPPQATGVLNVQVKVRDRRTLPLPLSLPLSAPRGPPSPPVLPPSLPPPSSPWLMRSKGSDHIKRESASTLPQ